MLNREQIKLGMTVYGISYMPGRLTWNGSYKNFVNFIGQVVSFDHDTVVVQCDNPDHHGYVRGGLRGAQDQPPCFREPEVTTPLSPRRAAVVWRGTTARRRRCPLRTQNQRQISMGISDSLSTRSTELPSISSSTGLKP